jgi:2-dehydro-3-deoxygluconokinase
VNVNQSAIVDVKPESTCRWDLVALGEVMLRFDPGDRRVSTARSFDVWEGGGEYNVARGLKRAFGLRTAVVTAFADNPVGQLLGDLLYQGGVDQSHVRWVPYDGVGRTVRNGLNFTERGFGVRAPLGCADRGNTAASQLEPGDIPWDDIFGDEGARWLHTGGIFAALSETTSQVAAEAMRAARSHQTVVSYDLNYRESLWKAIGGAPRAHEVNAELVQLVDVLIGNEEDYPAALGGEVAGVDTDFSRLEPQAYEAMLTDVLTRYPNLKLAAVTLRRAVSSTRNDWGAICRGGGRTWTAMLRTDLEIYDRVGGGDSFASGLIYGLLSGQDPQRALELGAAHGALAMTTPGDTSMATLAEVERLVRGGTARIVR